ncbi:MAG: hypothetical protein OQL19_15665 [Gammaproteobacteria bacterium]|nr:hypothetical protein [Gammaproteobacteria bacterium]
MDSSNSILSDYKDITRIVVMGNVDLMQGFALLGFETWPDAQKSDVEKLLLDLLEHHEKALVMLESHLAHFDTPILKKIREKGGNIILTEIPSFYKPDDYHPVIDSLIMQALGPNALEDKNDE